jgi:peptidoglycan-associated lipoprotein
MFRKLTAVTFTLCALLGACSSDPKPPPDTAGNNIAPPPAPTGDDANKSGADDDSSNVRIDDKIKNMCNLPEAHFGFDSASVSASAKTMLDKLAECFISGPAKGMNMKIVGHADPRGETEYNFALGQRRAGSVATYLTKAGLEDGRLEASSRGELEATGSDDAGWAKDRRVEILLDE